MTQPTADPIHALDLSDCWDLLRDSELGRVAVSIDGSVDIFPVNYVITNEKIYFSSAPGSKLISITANPRVAFEVDGVRDRKRWSVVVKGRARRVSLDEEIEQSGVLDTHSFAPTEKWNYVQISPIEITGRRFYRARRRNVL